MFGLDGWDIAIIAVAAYISVTALVRLMHRRRDALVDDIGRQVETEVQRRREQKKQQKRKKLHDQIRGNREGN